MNPILNDPLVRKYFGCGPHDLPHSLHHPHDCDAITALRVLDAMVAPIKGGEKYLRIGGMDPAVEVVLLRGSSVTGIHAYDLRLPDAHQEPDYEKELAARACDIWRGTKKDASNLNELIDLARKAERQKIEREAKR